MANARPLADFFARARLEAERYGQDPLDAPTAITVLTAEDIALTCHAHPTYSEAVREAALACGDGPIHS